MRQIRIVARADLDIDDAADEYAESGGLALGLGFLGAVERTWETWREFPHSGRECDWRSERLRGVRRSQVGDPFGVYLVFYRVTADAVEVLRVLHGSRDVQLTLSESMGESDPLTEQ